ncbi:MAG: substrate-binding domain-containing protein [Candidatus Galacturonibacter soehngenii]|uniref:Phosphate ABC transporter substrate-binding protein n=2 Tax=Candidatus Galacturonatibacter soehngenii TaxID=2307010 RepID=A0A7V7QM49_9FIRM|nr:phosphate ABC transporter substrate-binding protein [Candidatus Galacturonibacter soehngenii]MBA4688446.1 substrate-binding domain-containing protein [Candidatus Galacturonibacter soehngenii]
MKKLLCFAATATLSMVLLAGCGSSSTGESSSTSTTTDSVQSTDSVTTTTEDTSKDKVTSDFDTSNDITVVSREDGSGTRGAFIELFGVEEKDADGNKEDMTTEEATISNSTSVVMTTVAGDDYAIGYISLGSLNDTVKALKIDGANPTVENIKSKAYKIARPFNIATKGDVSEVAKDFIDFIMSANGQAVVEDNGYISASENSAYAGSKPAGKIVIAGSSSVSPVMEKLKEAYLAINTNAEIEVQTSDSTTGMTSTIDGICDIGMASRELKDSELESGLTNMVIAMDGIAVVVNKNNSFDELTSDQVKSIYTGETLAWDEIK